QASPAQRFRVVDVVPFEEEDESPFVAFKLGGSAVASLDPPGQDRVTLTSSLRSLGPFSVCSRTVPMPRTYILWSTVPGSSGVVSCVSSATVLAPVGRTTVLNRPITLKWSSAWPL